MLRNENKIISIVYKTIEIRLFKIEFYQNGTVDSTIQNGENKNLSNLHIISNRRE